jgi:hypothetical protein
LRRVVAFAVNDGGREGSGTTMNKDEDCICFYRDSVMAGHDDPAAKTMRRFNSLVIIPFGC